MVLFMLGALSGAAGAFLMLAIVAVNDPDYWKEERKHGESKDD